MGCIVVNFVILCCVVRLMVFRVWFFEVEYVMVELLGWKMVVVIGLLCIGNRVNGFFWVVELELVSLVFFMLWVDGSDLGLVWGVVCFEDD